MKFLTVAAAIFASTSLAVPTNNHNGGGACVPRPNPGNSNTSSAPGGNPTGGHTSSGPGTTPTDGNTSSGPGTKPTGSHTSSTPGIKPTGSHTSSGTETMPSSSSTSSGPGTNPTDSHTGSAPATTTTGSNTGSHTSSGPSTISTGHPGGEFHCPGGLYSNLQCCSVDVLGILGVDCEVPHHAPTSGDDFKRICAAAGKEAKCCVLPVAGQDVLCQDAIPGGNPPVHPTSVPSGHPTSMPGGRPTSVPGSNPTSVPGSNPTSVPSGNPTSVPSGHPTSVPGGNPTSVPGGNPTSVPVHPNPPPSGNNPSYCPPGLYSNPQCCSADVLGVVALDCSTPGRTLASGDNFERICAAVGKQAKCCVLPVAGQDLLCQDAIDGGNSPGQPTSAPGGNPTSAPGGQPTSIPGGNPTSVPGGSPTSVPGHHNPPPVGNDPYYCPSGLYSNPQCCAVDVLGVADLDCSTPSQNFTTGDEFRDICATIGQHPMCCVLPVAGQAVLCEKPVGI